MVLFLAFLSALAWIYLIFFRSGYWRASVRLEPAPEPKSWPEVVAVIPARNEAAQIQDIIKAHLATAYPGRFSLILVDDQSTDDTSALAQIAADAPRERSRAFSVLEGSALPAGWTGKLWAMQQGLDAVARNYPDAAYVLLTDADILFDPASLQKLVAKAEAENLALTSLMARLDARGFWGGLLIPAFIYFFQQLYPFKRVNNPDDDAAAAAGGCMLARQAALREIGGVSRFKDNLIDDCALARAIKDSTPSTRIWLGLADDDVVSLRDNRPLASIWTMVARTAYAQLRYSGLLLGATLLGMGLLYLAPPVLSLFFAAHHSGLALTLALLAWALMSLSYWPTLRAYRQPLWAAFLLPIAGAYYAAMTASSAIAHWRGRGGAWKGRTYSSIQGPAK